MMSIENKNFLVTGGTGFLGKNLVPFLRERGAVVDTFGSQFDLSTELGAEQAFRTFTRKYDYIIHAAVLQGAGDWPLHHKAEQFDINCRIHNNVFKQWSIHQPQARMIGIGSSCSYPGDITVLPETCYWDGPMHESVDIYGLTKKMMNVGIEAYKSQYGLKGTTVVFATLYGPHDSFDREKAHVVSALIRKFVEAKENGDPQVEVWGDGTQTRELIYIEDQIRGLMTVLDYDGSLINIGTGTTHSIRELAETIQRVVDYDGEIYYNTNRFVGVKHKVLDVTLAKDLFGWTTDAPISDFEDTIQKSVDWFVKHKEELE